MNGNYQLVRQAILNGQQVTATYNGCTRRMCPHAIGTNEGRELALFYQFGGISLSGLWPDGDPRNWRCIRIDRLSDLYVENGTWHTAPNSSGAQTYIGEIDVEVSYG